MIVCSGDIKLKQLLCDLPNIQPTFFNLLMSEFTKWIVGGSRSHAPVAKSIIISQMGNEFNGAVYISHFISRIEPGTEAIWIMNFELRSGHRYTLCRRCLASECISASTWATNE